MSAVAPQSLSLDIDDREANAIDLQDLVNSLRGSLSEYDFGGSLNPTQSDDYESYINRFTTSTFASTLGSLDLVNEDLREVMLDPRLWIDDGISSFEASLDSTPSVKEKSTIEWISFIRNKLTHLDDRERLADRIWELTEDVTIDDDSLATFVMFLSINDIQKNPQIGINDKGYIDALWRYSKDKLVEIIFNPGHESQLVTFSSDLNDEEVVNRRVASLPIRNIMDVLLSRDLDLLFYY